MAFFRLLIGSPKLSRIPLKVCTHLGCIPQPDAGNYGGELGCSATVTRRLELAFEHSTFLLQCSGILFSGSWLQNCRSGSNGMFVQKNIRAAAHLGHRWLLLSLPRLPLRLRRSNSSGFCAVFCWKQVRAGFKLFSLLSAGSPHWRGWCLTQCLHL